MATRRKSAPPPWTEPRRRPGPAPRPGVTERLSDLAALRLARPLTAAEQAEENRLHGILYHRIRREAQRQETQRHG